MKSLKNRWESELDAKIPALREDILSAPIPSCEREEASAPLFSTPWYKRFFSKFSFSWKPVVPLLTACVIGLTTLGVALSFLVQPVHVGVISVEVNPQALFSVDEEGIVTAVVSVNEDADILLSENRALEMTGKRVEEAVTIFVDYTARLGFLDLDAPDAVRISSCEENDYLREVGDRLESYFLNKGSYVAVAQEKMDLPNFCARVKMDTAESVELLKTKIESIPALLFERESEGKTTEELQQVYREKVPEYGVKELLNAQLSLGLEKVDTINRISDLYEEILLHRDNPLRYGYWEWVDKVYPDTMSAIMQEMSQKLSFYKTQYGVEIDGALSLFAERAKCALIPVQILRDVLLDYTMDAFMRNYEAICEIFSLLGIDEDKISIWYDLPDSIESYKEKVKDYQSARFALLGEKNLSIFEKTREGIKAEEYTAFVNEIISRYGSLSAYYDFLQEN